MTAEQKAEFTAQLKIELKPFISSLANDQAEKVIRPLRNTVDDYIRKSTEHREMIVKRFQEELQTLSDYFKKLTTKIETEIRDE